MSKPLHHRAYETLIRWNVAFSISCHRSSRYFYLLLAFIVSLVIAVTSILEADFASFDEGTFDTIMKLRWSSPPAAQDIVILDIDEKSLAEMAPMHGRWPWKRDVFAQVLAELEYVEAKSIMFMVLIAEPDKEHPRSDDSFSYVASESFVTVYPVVRLPPENDENSKLKVCDLIPAGMMRCDTNATVAVILPALPGMQHDLAIMNNHLDEDGILRSWSLLWEEEDEWEMPSMVGGALALARVEPKVEPDSPYIINWRNEKNRYQRVSIVDYLATLNGDLRIAPDYFKDKHVIIASSASGLTIKHATSTGLIDDGEILATAMDDAINGTNLKELPEWVIILGSLLFVWGMGLLFTFGRSQKDLDGIFVAIEISTVVVMVLAINYTRYFIDIMPVATFGLIYYSIARIHYENAESVFTGKEHYLAHFIMDEKLDSVGIITFSDEDNEFLPSRKDLVSMQQGFDGRVFAFNESFQDDQLLEKMNHICCTVVIASGDELYELQNILMAELKQRGMGEHVAQTFEFPDLVMQNRVRIPHFVATKTLSVMTQLPFEEDEA